MRRWIVFVPFILFVAVLSPPQTIASDGPHCGDEGVWIQILGAGGPELHDGDAGPSYLLWIDNQARLLIDAAPGASVRFDEAGAAFEDLDAIAFSQLSVHHAADFPAFIDGSRFHSRTRPLPVLGPDGGSSIGVSAFVERLIGPDGAYPELADFLTVNSRGGYRLSVRGVPASGRRRWARFGNENLRLAAVPVHHGDLPALAWRVEAKGFSAVFAGDFSNRKNVLAEFAADADALVVSHAEPEHSRGAARERYATPGQIGRVAERAAVRMLILGHRMNRTRGRESQSRKAIEANYGGPLIFADDLECWGL